MVGGKVIEKVDTGNRYWVNVQDTTYTKDTCAIYIEKNSDAQGVEVGDSLWWQGRYAMWTPKSRDFADRKIPRIGFSGVSRPVEKEAA